MLVLDTNHVSELFFRSAAGGRLLFRRCEQSSATATTAVTVEETLRGWLADIHRHTDLRKQIPCYDRLVRRVELFGSWLVLPLDDDAAARFEALHPLRSKVGTQDLKIASIALAHDATLLTRNIADFIHVPGLRVENWLD